MLEYKRDDAGNVNRSRSYIITKKEDILSVLSNPSLEKRGICTLPLVMSFGISKEPILMIPRVAAGGSTTSSFFTPIAF